MWSSGVVFQHWCAGSTSHGPCPTSSHVDLVCPVPGPCITLSWSPEALFSPSSLLNFYICIFWHQFHFISPILEDLFLNATSSTLNASGDILGLPPNHPTNLESHLTLEAPAQQVCWCPLYRYLYSHQHWGASAPLSLAHRTQSWHRGECFISSCSHTQKTPDNISCPQERMVFPAGEFHLE